MTPEEQARVAEHVKALALKAEGEELLKAVAANQPKSAIVGPDGKPVAAEPPKGPSREELLAARTAKSDKIKALFKKDPMLASLGSVMADLYQALIWVSQDIAAREGMTDDLAAHMSRMCQEAVLQQPIVADVLISNLKKHSLPCLVRLKEMYARLEKQQRAKVSRINKDLLTKGVTMPSGLADAGLPKLKLGESIILRGAADTIQFAVRQIVSIHESADKGKTCVFSTREEKEVIPGRITMPAVWWKNCADDVKTLDDILSPAAQAAVTMIGVDDLRGAATGLGQAAARLHSWCVNSLAVGVFGEPSDEGEITFEGPFRRYVVTDAGGVLTFSLVNLKEKKNG